MSHSFIGERQIDQVKLLLLLFRSIDRMSFICSDWEIVWDAMNQECQDEITLVEGDYLLETIENYLGKHK